MRTALVCAVLMFTVSAVGCTQRRIDPSALERSSAALSAPVDFKNPDYDALATAVELATNAAREANGKPPVSTHMVLRKAGARHAEKMVDEDFFAHEDPNTARLRTPQQRVEAAGGANAITAENIADVPALSIAAGEPVYTLDKDRYLYSRTPQGDPIPPHTYAEYGARVVEGWMNSPGHRRNVLHDDAVEQGIGAAIHIAYDMPYFIVVQVFQFREELR